MLNQVPSNLKPHVDCIQRVDLVRLRSLTVQTDETEVIQCLAMTPCRTLIEFYNILIGENALKVEHGDITSDEMAHLQVISGCEELRGGEIDASVLVQLCCQSLILQMWVCTQFFSTERQPFAFCPQWMRTTTHRRKRNWLDSAILGSAHRNVHWLADLAHIQCMHTRAGFPLSAEKYRL